MAISAAPKAKIDFWCCPGNHFIKGDKIEFATVATGTDNLGIKNLYAFDEKSSFVNCEEGDFSIKHKGYYYYGSADFYSTMKIIVRDMRSEHIRSNMKIGEKIIIDNPDNVILKRVR